MIRHSCASLSLVSLFGLGVEVLLQRHAELLAQSLELLEILGVLSLVLDLGLDTYISARTNTSLAHDCLIPRAAKPYPDP